MASICLVHILLTFYTTFVLKLSYLYVYHRIALLTYLKWNDL